MFLVSECFDPIFYCSTFYFSTVFMVTANLSNFSCWFHLWMLSLLISLHFILRTALMLWGISYSPWKSSLFTLQYLITHFSDFQLASLGSFLIHESVFFLSGLPFIYLERAGLLSKYKIQVNSIFFAAIVSNCYYFVNIKFGRGGRVLVLGHIT